MAMNARLRSVVLCVAACIAVSQVQAAKRPARKLKYDPKVPAVDLFDAIDKGSVETSVVARNPHEASLYVTNQSDAPVSIKMPAAVVAVHVLKQNFGQLGRGGPGQGGPNGNGPGGMAQSIGGGMGMNGGNMNGGNNL